MLQCGPRCSNFSVRVFRPKLFMHLSSSLSCYKHRPSYPAQFAWYYSRWVKIMNIIPFYGCYLFFFYSLWTLPVAQLKITNGRYKNAYIYYYLLHKIEYICIIRDISHAQYILVQFVTSHTLSIYLYNSRHLTHSVYTCTIRDISHTHYILVQFMTSHTLCI